MKKIRTKRKLVKKQNERKQARIRKYSSSCADCNDVCAYFCDGCGVLLGY